MRFEYEPDSDLATLAASYAFGLAKNHAFVDGNERMSFAALFTFLGVNGQDLDAAEDDAVRTVLALASGELSEEALASWIRLHSRTGKTALKPRR
jgi:death-on-curing protein